MNPIPAIESISDELVMSTEGVLTAGTTRQYATYLKKFSDFLGIASVEHITKDHLSDINVSKFILYMSMNNGKPHIKKAVMASLHSLFLKPGIALPNILQNPHLWPLSTNSIRVSVIAYLSFKNLCYIILLSSIRNGKRT